MTSEAWARLASPFDLTALEWRVIALSDNAHKAQVRPQIRYRMVVARLDDVLGVDGWSNRFIFTDRAVSCELVITGITKSAVASFQLLPTTAQLSEDALVYAAELFGLLPPIGVEERYWVDYDHEAKTILYEPDINASPEEIIIPKREVKSEGQQVIDRLLERLREEGMGLEAAKLVVEHGGYGQDADEARILYKKLRALLLGETVET